MTDTTKTTIAPTTIKGFDKLLADGATKDKLEGFLLFEEVPKKVAIAYLKERGLIGKVTFRSWLTATCSDRVVLWDEFVTEIVKHSKNVNNHLTTYNNERHAYNNIHAKYDAKAKKAVETDLILESKLADSE